MTNTFLATVIFGSFDVIVVDPLGSFRGVEITRSTSASVNVVITLPNVFNVTRPSKILAPLPRTPHPL